MEIGVVLYSVFGLVTAILFTAYLMFRYAALRTKPYIYTLASLSIVISVFSCIILPLDIITVRFPFLIYEKFQGFNKNELVEGFPILKIIWHIIYWTSLALNL